MFFNPSSRWAIAPVFQLLDIRREPGLSPFGYQFVSLEDIIPMCLAMFFPVRTNCKSWSEIEMQRT
jgi:hypothetical protein